jgi:deoxycytidylate deaminase
MHAAEDLLAQAGDRSITDIYTERQPCRECALQIPERTNVTWSFAWSTDRAVQRDTNTALKAAISALFDV